MYSISRDPNTGLWVVIDTATNKRLGRAELPSDAISLAISNNGMPASERNALLAQATSIEQQEAQQQQASNSSASAGDTVASGQAAKDDNASPTAPAPAQEVISGEGRIGDKSSVSSTNAVSTPTQANGDVDAGTDATVRTTQNTQAISTTSNNSLAEPSSAIDTGDATQTAPAAPTQGPGAAATKDDGRAKNETQSRIDLLYGTQPIVPQANVLDQYASYTYSISVYLMTLAGYKKLINSGNKKSIAGTALLFQSGGAPQNTAGLPGRNPYFSLDYYIDNLEIKGLIQGKGTGSPHNSTSMKFTVIEPMGITLINNLNDAVTEYIYNNNLKLKTQGGGGQAPWGGQNYLMAIRFYGYDINGKLIRGGTQSPNSGADINAVVEKFIPFQISTLSFKVAGRAVEYQFECVTPGNNINTGATRGTIPYDIELSAGTISEALAGDVTVTTGNDSQGRESDAGAGRGDSVFAATDPRRLDLPTSPVDSPGVGTANNAATGGATAPANTASATAPGKADAAPSAKLTVTKGLMATMNKFQADQVSQGLQKLPDIYEVDFASPALASARVTYNGGKSKAQSSMAKGGTAADQKNPDKQSADLNTNTLRAKAGTQLIYFLDQLLKNSSYISDQATVIIDPETNKQTPQGKGGNNLAWYKIGLTAEPLAWDEIRKDYQYRIRYTVTPYRVEDVDSPYFSKNKFRGVHKTYPYWFTGENTAVLSYEQTYNTLYTRILSGVQANDATSTSLNELTKRSFSPRSAQSSQGASGTVNEPAANAADKLYSPADLAETTMKIVGDPAWIFQGEVAGGISGRTFVPDPFLSDGTINTDASQSYFEVNFNLPGDYNINTGLMTPGTLRTGKS